MRDTTAFVQHLVGEQYIAYGYLVPFSTRVACQADCNEIEDIHDAASPIRSCDFCGSNAMNRLLPDEGTNMVRVARAETGEQSHFAYAACLKFD